MPTHAALLRGINVGKAKRISMADLRSLVAALGFGDVATLLNSGNVVFSATKSAARGAAARIGAAITDTTGVTCHVVVLAAAELDEILAANPLTDAMADPSHLLVAVLVDAADARHLTDLAAQDWGMEAFAAGPRAAYLWCRHGIADSKLPTLLDRAVRSRVTARNWATMLKLQALLRA